MDLKTGAACLLMLIMVAALCLPGFAHAMDIKKERLENGLVVIHVERRELPIVMATMLVKASPLQEEAAGAGTAYLTAKMLMEGTTGRTAVDINRKIDYIGGSIETAVTHDFTTLSLSVLKKDADMGFDLLSDIAVRPLFSEGELSRRKTLLAGSLKKMEESPSYITDREFMKRLFGDSAYGRRIEGDINGIGRIGRPDIIKFHNAHYRPDNAVLVVVGDLGKEELAGLVNRYFASWKAVKTASTGQPAVLPIKNSEKKPRIEVIDKDVSQSNIMMGHMGISRNNPDYYAAQIMNYILGGGGFASRLMKVVRDDMGLTYSIHSVFAANRYPGSFVIEVQTKNESAGRVIGETLKQVRALRATGVTDEELRDAKDFMIGSFPRRIETGRKIADFLAVAHYYELGDDYMERYRGYIEAVTKADVQRAARKYLNEEDILIVVVGDKKKLKL
jgi:zinc protease